MSKRVLFVTPEIYPYVKTGGLGDVSASLPLALKDNVDIRLFVPGYPQIMSKLSDQLVLKTFPEYFGAKNVRIILGRLDNGLMAYALSSPEFFDRSGPYVDSHGRDWEDNHLRFAALCRAAADLYLYDGAWQPDIIHGNDWQTGLIPAYLAHRPGPRPATAMTIHNLAYQGLFPSTVFGQLDLPQDSFSINGIEYYDQVGFLKAGLFYADKLTTVSPTYAREIQTPEFGCGLEGLLQSRSRDLVGILNGIDQDVWNPMTDEFIDSPFSSNKLTMKALNKKALLESLNMPVTDRPVFGIVGRLTSQKGFDILLKTVPGLLSKKATMVFMGQGDAAMEKQWQALSERYPNQVSAHIGYDESFEHRLHAGSDAIIMPSRYEPCGLVQMYGQRYGAVPIVRNTGGLADTVNDITTNGGAGTGFTFNQPSALALENTLNRALYYFSKRNTWRNIQRNAMAQDFSWNKTAKEYGRIYADA